MIIDCSSTIKGNWKWNSTTFVSQSYLNDDQFQEFGLKWQGHGFTYITTPKWINKNNNNLDDFDIKFFCGSAIIVDIPDNKKINAQYIDEKLKNLKDKNINICIFATGHSIKFSNNSPEYWIKSPIIEDGVIEVLLKYSIKHLVLDFSCENILTKRDIEKKDFINPNEKIKIKLLEKNILLTENFIANHSSNYSFYIGLPISIPKGSTSPTRPILIDEWFGKIPKITDISTPLFNHWRWKLDIWEDTEILLNGQNRIETKFIFSGHGFNHCDAPRHMNKDGKTIQELPNQSKNNNSVELLDNSENEKLVEKANKTMDAIYNDKLSSQDNTYDEDEINEILPEEEEEEEKEEEEEEGVFEIELEGMSYFTTDEQNGSLYSIDVNGDPDVYVGKIENGIAIFK